MEILQRPFYQRDTVTVAQELVGKILVRNDGPRFLAGRIVETEAYKGSDDPASHAYRKKTERNRAMFGEVGSAYIYFVYGMHFALNVVARDKLANAGAVLIRAVEPLEGIEHMRELRRKDAIQDLASGPGKLAQAYSINQLLYGCDMTKKGPLYVVDAESLAVQATPRIGIQQGKEKAWRFVISYRNLISK